MLVLNGLWWLFIGLALSFDLLSTSIQEDKVRCTIPENFSNCFQLLLFCGVFGLFIHGGSYNINNFFMWGHHCQDILIQWQYFGSKVSLTTVWLEGNHFGSKVSLTMHCVAGGRPLREQGESDHCVAGGRSLREQGESDHCVAGGRSLREQSESDHCVVGGRSPL